MKRLCFVCLVLGLIGCEKKAATPNTPLEKQATSFLLKTQRVITKFGPPKPFTRADSAHWAADSKEMDSLLVVAQRRIDTATTYVTLATQSGDFAWYRRVAKVLADANTQHLALMGRRLNLLRNRDTAKAGDHIYVRYQTGSFGASDAHLVIYSDGRIAEME